MRSQWYDSQMASDTDEMTALFEIDLIMTSCATWVVITPMHSAQILFLF